jgi:hypothetical protein
MTTTNKKPTVALRDGNLRAAIWQNSNENGEVYNVQITRTWKDEQGTYHDSDTFSPSELLRVAHLAGKVYDRINEMRQAAYERARALMPNAVASLEE